MVSTHLTTLWIQSKSFRLSSRDFVHEKKFRVNFRSGSSHGIFWNVRGGRHQCGQKMRLFQIPDDMTLASQADFDKF